jgi:hypothetical protein
MASKIVNKQQRRNVVRDRLFMPKITCSFQLSRPPRVSLVLAQQPLVLTFGRQLDSPPADVTSISDEQSGHD